MDFYDDKLIECVWNAKIPIKVDMAIGDIADIEKPPSLFVYFIFI